MGSPISGLVRCAGHGLAPFSILHLLRQHWCILRASLSNSAEISSRLAALFGPQHGYLGQTQDNMIEWEGYRHPRLGIPVHSLYGTGREPTHEMLRGLDALIVDLQDIGTRYYTFIWTLYLCLKACNGKASPWWCSIGQIPSTA